MSNARVVLAEWLHRRYGPPVEWKLLGGRERGRWINDAVAAETWLSERGHAINERKDAPSEVGP